MIIHSNISNDITVHPKEPIFKRWEKELKVNQLNSMDLKIEQNKLIRYV